MSPAARMALMWAARRWRLVGASAAPALLLAGASVGSALAQPALSTTPPAPSLAGVSIADFIAEASQRVGLPTAWIAAVMRAESAFDPRATSPKGAMGLMQLMPDTWAGLRVRLALGPDPYDPRDNVLAGARYLRDLYDQFGAAGFLAAYNAGPARYLDFLARGRPLPAETRAYVRRISSAINGGAAVAPPLRVAAVTATPRPALFVALSGDGDQAAAAAVSRAGAALTVATPAALDPGPGALFVGGWEAAR